MDIDKISEKVKEALDKTDLDEKIKAGAEKLKEKVTEIDTDALKAQVKENAEMLKGKVQETLDKTDLDEKIKARAEELKEKLQSKL